MTIESFLDAIFLPLLIFLWVKALGALLPIAFVLLGFIGITTGSNHGKRQ